MEQELAETQLRLTVEMHMRPLQSIAKTAMRFKSDVTVGLGEHTCNGKSFFELIDMALKVSREGTKTFRIKASGCDAKSAINAFSDLCSSGAEQEFASVNQ